MLRTARFLHAFWRPSSPSIEQRELTLATGVGEVEATLLRPRRAKGPLPGWVVLHGITVPGRRHETLMRFARSLCASGAEVLLPDVPPWRDLRIDPAVAGAITTAAVEELSGREDASPGGVRLVGFSFGATQAIVSSIQPALRDRLKAVIGFGGYCDLGRTLRCMMAGEHEWDGSEYLLQPDPYGRWIVVANYLHGVPDLAHMAGLADALRRLAMDAGERRIYAAAAVYDPLKARLRAGLEADEREIWDVLAPPSHVQPDRRVARELAERFTTAAAETHPELDPAPFLRQVTVPVRLAHGVEDSLVPFTEMWRLERTLRPHTDVSATLTRLFAHSTGGGRLPLLHYPREVVRYLAMLDRVLR